MADVGRRQVKAVLEHALVPEPSRGAVVFVSGPAGIGKSTILAECTKHLAVTGVRVVSCAAYESAERRPFAAIGPLLHGAADASPPDPSVSTGGESDGGAAPDPVTAALTTVDEWCAAGPTLVWVDDAHHLDAGSATVLMRLARASLDLPLTLLLSARWQPSQPNLAILADLATLSVEIPPLRPDEVEDVVTGRTGHRPGPALAKELEVAAGNPLAVTILVDLLEQRGAVREVGDLVEVDVTDGTVPEAATMAARAQLRILPDVTRELATTVAVLGPPADPEDVAAVMGRPLAALTDDLAPAEQAGVMRWADGALVFGHDTYQDALLAVLPQPLFQAIHRKAVRVMRERGAPDEQVAEHVLRGADAGAVSLVRSVAATVRDTAPGVAADLLAQVQPLIAPDDTDAVILERAQALMLSGRAQECEDLVRTYLPRASSTAASRRLQQLSLIAVSNRANIPAWVGQIDNMLRSPDLPAELRAELMAQRCGAFVNGGHLRAAEAAAEQLRRAYPEEADRLLGFRTALILLLHGRAIEAERLMERVLSRTEATMTQQYLGPVWRVACAHYARPPHEAREVAAAARSFSDSYAVRWTLQFHDVLLGQICLDGGWWDDAAAVLDAGLELTSEIGSGWVAGPQGTRALVDVHRGNAVEARKRLDALAARNVPPAFGLDFPGQADLLLTEYDAVQQCVANPETDWSAAHRPAAERAAQLWNRSCDLGSELWQSRIAVDVLRVATPDVRHRLHEAMSAWSTGQMPGWDPVRDLVLGIGAQDVDRAAHAAETFAAAGNAPMAATAWEEVGLLAGQRRQLAEARHALRLAVDGYDALGAVVDATRLRARAARVGVRAGRPDVRHRPSTGWEALTPTERTIADRVRQGLTNPQIAAALFLSPRTVQSHVSSILRKTGLHSRVEIAAT